MASPFSQRPPEGIIILDKPEGQLSFGLVSFLRRFTNQSKIGHAGTLDPFATGVMVMLLGAPFTRLSAQFLNDDKEYVGTITLGIETDSYDRDGVIIAKSLEVPTLEELKSALAFFQGKVEQIPPMFSAKKIGGKKLCDLARKGKVVDRAAVTVEMHTELLAYEYPYIRIKVSCSKGTYIRSIAHDLGKILGTGAHLSSLRRTRSGKYHIEQAVSPSFLVEGKVEINSILRNPT